MTGRRWLAGALALAVLAAASFGVSAAISSRRAAGVAPMGCRCDAVLMSYLELTPAQQERAAPICEEFRASQQAAIADMQAARGRLLDVLKQPRPAREDIDAALGDVGRVQARMQRAAAEYLLELKPVLSDGQQAKLFDMVGQRFCQQGACGGMGRGSGGPGRGGGPGWMKHLR